MFTTKPTPDDIVQGLQAGVASLKAQNSSLKDRLRRLESEIQSEVKMLTAAMEGKQETFDQVRRRISRLKGSLEYPGRID